MEDLKLIIEVEEGLYVKTGKNDTYDLEEAKRFKSLGYLRRFAYDNGVRIHRIVQDCGDGVYATYDR